MPERLLTSSTSEFSSASLANFRHYDILINPDSGGRYQPNLDITDTEVIVRPTDQSLISTEIQPNIVPFVLAPDLQIDPRLRKAKYDALMEIGRFIRDINRGLNEGKSLAEAVENSANEFEINLREYYLEIIKQKPVLPHLNRLDEKNGQSRMVGNNGEPVVNSISAQERNSAPLQASKKIEEFLLSAPNNSFAVLMSPSGWNGYIDTDGIEDESHLNSETMVFWKDQTGTLKGLTLVTDLSNDQTAQVMTSLEVSKQALTGNNEKEKIANIVRNPAMLSFPSSTINPFEYVLDKILAARGINDIKLKQHDGSMEIRSVAQIISDIQNFKELLAFSQEEENLVSSPKKFILEQSENLGNKSVQQEIIYKIEKAVLLLTRKYLIDSGRSSQPTSPYPIHTNISFPDNQINFRDMLSIIDDNFAPEIAFLKTRAGCPARSGSGRSLRGISLGSSLVGGISGGFSESDQYDSLEFPCPVCNGTNRRPKGEFVKFCQHCGTDKVAC